MIEVKNLTFSYSKDKQALHGLDFTVEDGEIFGFLGPNGSGKSTTQKILTGILKGYGGSVSLFGQDISNVRSQEFFQKIGVLFEFPYLYANLSAVDNLNYFASFYPREQRRDVGELLEALEFKPDFLRKPVSSYSKGMRQRVSMARALISNPRLLFLDEPTSGLDPSGAVLFRKIIQQERKKGTTVFVTTHNMLDADLLCDRVAFISNGNLVALDTPKRLKEKNSNHQVVIDYCALFKKDCRMLAAGKFFIMVAVFLVAYTAYVNLGYIRFMQMEPYNVYLYDPAGTQADASPLIKPVQSMEDLDAALLTDANGVGLDASAGDVRVVLYKGAEHIDRHRTDYALSLLNPASDYSPQVIGANTPEQKARKEITCELLFFELAAVGFLGIAAVLFKEKSMGVIRIHAILPVRKNLFLLSKLAVFLLSDVIFALLLTWLNVGLADGAAILPAVLIQAAVLSLVMALVGLLCALLLKDFRQFTLAYLIIAIFAATPVFLSANTSVKFDWINWHPFYHIYMGLKNAYFGMTLSPVYCIGSAGAVLLLFLAVPLVCALVGVSGSLAVICNIVPSQPAFEGIMALSAGNKGTAMRDANILVVHCIAWFALYILISTRRKKRTASL